MFLGVEQEERRKSFSMILSFPHFSSLSLFENKSVREGNVNKTWYLAFVFFSLYHKLTLSGKNEAKSLNVL